MKSDDVSLIEKTLAGDKDAFGELVLRYQDRLFGSLVHMLGSAHDARDVGQEAFLSAFQKLHTFRKEASFYSWLFRIAYNAAITNRRKLKRQKETLSTSGDPTGIEHIDRNPSLDPAHRLRTSETIQQVRNALDQLPPDYRDALILKEIEGMNYEQIAEILHCPLGTVRSRIHRGRCELKQILERVVEREPETSRAMVSGDDEIKSTD